MGEDRWVALGVPDDKGWQGLCALMGRRDWAADEGLATAEGRRIRQDELEEGIAAWAIHQPRDMAAAALQDAGVAAGAVLHLDEVAENFHFQARNFFYDTNREHVGQHWQASLPFTRNGERYPLRGLAPYLGGDSEQVLTELLGVPAQQYERLLEKAVVSLKPTQLRGT
jgi:crotonobetainyl-CoA:carnitine CoA-transferase CaiB-like acyl-CoA transferase